MTDTPIEVATVPLAELREYPGNPRRGDVEAIAASLEANEQFQPLIVQRSTGFVLSGNHTLAAMRMLGWEAADVRYVDADDDRAARIVLAANRTHELGGFDDTALLALLRATPDLDGTGYDSRFLDDLASSHAEPYTDDEVKALVHKPIFTSDGSRTSAGRRIIVLDMPSPVYGWVVEALGVVRERHGLASNLDALAWLLGAHVATLPERPAVIA